MVVWRTDPGNGNNGAWYAYTELDAPYLPLVALPAPQPTARSESQLVRATATDTATDTGGEIATDDSVAQQPMVPNVTATQAPPQVRQLANPATPLLIGLLPVSIFISVVFYRHNRRRY